MTYATVSLNPLSFHLGVELALDSLKHSGKK